MRTWCSLIPTMALRFPASDACGPNNRKTSPKTISANAGCAESLAVYHHITRNRIAKEQIAARLTALHKHQEGARGTLPQVPSIPALESADPGSAQGVFLDERHGFLDGLDRVHIESGVRVNFRTGANASEASSAFPLDGSRGSLRKRRPKP